MSTWNAHFPYFSFIEPSCYCEPLLPEFGKQKLVDRESLLTNGSLFRNENEITSTSQNLINQIDYGLVE